MEFQGWKRSEVEQVWQTALVNIMKVQAEKSSEQMMGFQPFEKTSEEKFDATVSREEEEGSKYIT